MARPLQLPYDAGTRCEDRYAWFDAIRALGWAVFLDSGDPARSGGRYDILAAAPRALTTAREGAFASLVRCVGAVCAALWVARIRGRTVRRLRRTHVVGLQRPTRL